MEISKYAVYSTIISDFSLQKRRILVALSFFDKHLHYGARDLELKDFYEKLDEIILRHDLSTVLLFVFMFKNILKLIKFPPNGQWTDDENAPLYQL